MPHSPPGAAGAGAGVEERVLGVVGELVAELRGGASAAVARGDTLEGDLGISSLERVELLIRLERTFGVRLGDDAMAGAETPADLADAVARAGDAPAAEAGSAGAGTVAARDADAGSTSARATASAAATTAAGTGSATAAGARTVVDALAWHAERTPDRIHMHLREDAGGETPLTHGWLWREAQAVAGGLADRGLGRGDTVAIMLRTERRFFPTFIGALMAGCVPVPLYPPFRLDRIEEYVGRQAAILQNAGARLLVTFAAVQRVAGLLVRQVPDLEAVATPAEVTGTPRRPVPAAPDDPALIQYTSGSTGQPKGVLLSHGNLLANIRAIERRFDISPRDVVVSWLPLYHDMGLIGAWLGALCFGAPLALMSPVAFLARPVRWLQALDAHRGTLSPAPNFAFDLCATRVSDAELEGLDLGSVRVLLNGSEPVAPETLRRFLDRFTPYGLDPAAVYPVYGLAECALGLSTPVPPGNPIRIDRVRRAAFQATGHAEPAVPDDPAALRFVSVGRALPEHELAVFDADGGRAPERVEGRVRFRGPSTTSGYYRNPGATRDLIGPDGWLDSGDLGYLAGGDIFLTGRAKDLIIKAGRNFHPHEAEALACSVPGVRTGCAAAFGAPDPERGTERFVIVAETRVTGDEARTALAQAVGRAVGAALGVAPDRVVLAPPGAVAKTSSGKVRRGATRDAWLAGRLGRRRGGMAGQWVRLGAAWAGAALRAGAGRVGRGLFTGYVTALVLATAPVGWTALLAARRGGGDRIVGRWNRLVMRLAGCPLEIAGREHVPPDAPVVFVANHASLIDAPVMMSALPVPVRFAVKARLTAYPLIGLAVRKGNHIPLGKRDQSERVENADAIRAPLDAGASLFVFPEGTFQAAPRLLPFRLGAFRAAVDAGCPVVPVAIRGTRRIWPAGTRLLRPGRVTVTFGPPLRASGSAWPEIVRLRDEARVFIAEHCGDR